MPKYLLTEQIRRTVWYERSIEVEADSEEEAEQKYRDSWDPESEFEMTDEYEIESRTEEGIITDIEELNESPS